MNKPSIYSTLLPPTSPLTTAEQNYIKGGMATSDEEKTAKVKKIKV
jgi:hypothetical protein